MQQTSKKQTSKTAQTPNNPNHKTMNQYIKEFKKKESNPIVGINWKIKTNLKEGKQVIHFMDGLIRKHKKLAHRLVLFLRSKNIPAIITYEKDRNTVTFSTRTTKR